MTRYGVVPMAGLAFVLASGCMDSAEDEVMRTNDALRTATAELQQDVRSTLDEFQTQVGQLDQRYGNVADDVAEAWRDTRDGIQESRESLEANLAKLQTASADDAGELRRDIAGDVEQLTDRVERAQLESVENGGEFLSASRVRMIRLRKDFQTLDEEAASLSAEAREEATGPMEELRDRASEVGTRLDGLADATADQISEQREDITQEIGALTASVRRQLFEMRQGVYQR